MNKILIRMLNAVETRIRSSLSHKKPTFWGVIMIVFICTGISVFLMTDAKKKHQVANIVNEYECEQVNNFPEKLSSSIEENNDEVRKQLSMGDIDNNGIEDYIIEEENTNPACEEAQHYHWALVYNDEQIYQGNHTLMCDFEVWFLDLDEDNQEEIIVHIFPHVNSTYLEEYVALKHTDVGWIELENSSQYNINTNSFPIHVYYGTSKNIFEIVCDGCDSIVIDVKEHYERIMEDGDLETSDYLYQYADDFLHNNKYSAGSEMGQTSNWGIWTLREDCIGGKNCIVARHGLEGLGGKDDRLGEVDIYFNYDGSGKIQILKMEFIPAEE